jgi:NADPH:quinone reductase-like Zn-dependent oxidoreductase
MKAFVVDKYKKQGALHLANLPEPELRDDDVLVQVHATAVNLLDSKVRDGEFKLILPYRPPFVLGHDVAGTVVRVGPKVRRFYVDTIIDRWQRLTGRKVHNPFGEPFELIKSRRAAAP